MSRPNNKEILAVFDAFDDDDTSTEQIIQMVCDHFDNEIDHGDVMEALARTAT